MLEAPSDGVGSQEGGGNTLFFVRKTEWFEKMSDQKTFAALGGGMLCDRPHLPHLWRRHGREEVKQDRHNGGKTHDSTRAFVAGKSRARRGMMENS